MAEASVASVEVTGASAALVAITVVAEASVASVEVTTASAALAAATASAEAASVAAASVGAADSAEAAGTGKGLPPRGRRGKVLCEGQRGRPFPDQNFI
jgi:hypothetical protein